jgi:hypothetical protein
LSAPTLVYVGNRPVITVRLSCAAAAPVRVSLRSSSTYLPVPATVTVGAGHDRASVSLRPKADSAGQYQATLTARLRTQSLNRTIMVDPGLAVFEIPPCSEPNCVNPDVLFTGVLPAGGATVALTSDNPAVTVPASYTFPAGSVGGEVTGVTVQTVAQNTAIKLSATFGGRTLAATVVLIPSFDNDSDDSVTLNPPRTGPLYGQEFGLQYSASLSNPAPASGETMTFTAGDPSVELQSNTWYVTPGTVDGYLDINTANVTSPVHTAIKVTVGSINASIPVTIEPGLASITNVPATIKGGDSFTATVNLAGPVDTATTVDLQSTWGILTVPSTVVIPAGQSSVSFTATTVPVTSNSDVTIYAYLGTSSINSTTVTVTP